MGAFSDNMPASQKTATITGATFAAALDGLLDLLNTQRDRIAGLENRLKAVEASGLKYAGVWQRAQTYPRGSVATHKGSAWVALADGVEAEPGLSAAWQLAVRRGDDGRDLR